MNNYHNIWKRWFYPLISVITALTICLTTPLPTKAIDLLPLIYQGIQAFNLSRLSDSQEIDLGSQMNQQIQKEVRISRNSLLNNYVQELGMKLAVNSDRPNLSYTFQVVEDEAINAFATVGGFCYINTGLLLAAENEAELASVIAHEMGHIEGKHLIKQMREQAVINGVASSTGLSKSKAVGIGVKLALNLPRSRKDEYDADARGLKILTHTKYAQSAMVSFMRKLEKTSGSLPTILSTHPGAKDRIVSLQRQISNNPSKDNNGLDNVSYKAKIRSIVN
ncbi:M48 family metalloprotease [Anabaena sp. FACHB-1237]|uniref:M48 family metallopeptidase n=1 Tax=Anabaena sp. FACHB-1237 TaxID=2692769 RepID=UPI00167FF712|nr:M48 family metallopeptidase [Anabaena sp. FACHB-1237]MBD2138898.1 M48 family metalloprotease [Anabaena sp. FACHB-1237]